MPASYSVPKLYLVLTEAWLVLVNLEIEQLIFKFPISLLVRPGLSWGSA